MRLGGRPLAATTGHHEAILADTLTPDLCVIGAGPAGLAVAEAARSLGVAVLLVDKGRLGGRALHSGAIPARALGAAAAHAHAMRNGASFGITADTIKVNFRRVHDHVDAVIAALSPARAAPHLEALGVQLLAGDAAFADKRTLKVGDTLVKARRFVVATGSRPVVPAIPGLDAVPYFTTDTILDNTRKLTHLVIIGGGALGLELAQSYARLGTEVTVLETGALLPGIDPELGAVALQRLEEEGVHLRPDTAVTAIHARSMGIGVGIRGIEGEAMLDASHILVAVERVPDLDALGLDQAGVRRLKDDVTRLELTAALRTSNPRIYAAGDAVGGAASVASALEQARAVVDSALLGLPARRSDLVPRVVGTAPEIAEIGLTERTARTKFGTRFRVHRAAFADNDGARARRETYGFAKLIVGPNGRLLGAGVAGSGAAELVALFSLALSANLTVAQLAGFAAPYPSLAEIASRLGRATPRADDTLVRSLLAINRLLG
jgi:pyruvate/2-oxoglutarate dehydrogenase complex dihydrolipoamide dehydrogenase (E3) component